MQSLNGAIENTLKRNSMTSRMRSSLKDPKRTFLVADIGGTNIKVGLSAPDGRLLAFKTFLTNSARGVEAVVRELAEVLKALADSSPADRKPIALGVGSPGIIIPKEGLVVKAPNLPGWLDLPLARILSQALDGLPTSLENDANLYALGEWLAGGARGLNNFLGITLGTGVGGGLILNGRLWQGSFLSAAEFGHLPVEYDGCQCGCGARGCLETLASATAMVRMGRDWLKEKRPSNYAGKPEELTSAELARLAQNNDPMAQAVLARAGWALGVAISGVLNMLGLEGVIFGGGAAGAFKFLRPHIFKIIQERAFVVKPERLRLSPGELGERAPLVGATALMIQTGY